MVMNQKLFLYFIKTLFMAELDLKDKSFIYAKDRREWRNWLKKNYKKAEEACLVYFKVSSGKPSISYQESVEKAICFCWIDGVRKKIKFISYTNYYGELS
jgi:uncharacterized protein YdeI (YjbR/CyaY-like superfamily)